MTTTEYQEHFGAALALARKHGFAVPTVPAAPTLPILTQRNKDELWALAAPPIFTFEEFIGGCLHITYNIRAAVKRLLQSPVYITIGAVSVGEREAFAFGEEQIERWVRDGVTMPLRDIHAWFTLPSMEIADYTFMFTYHAAFGKVMGGPVFRRPEELQGMSFRPILVADDFAERVGAIVGYSL